MTSALPLDLAPGLPAELAESVRTLFTPDAALTPVATGGSWFEGPAWLGENLIWSDVVENRLLAWSPARGARVWIEPSHHQNGHTVDRFGRLLAASHGERAVVRLERNRRWSMVADLVDGKRFNSPNDLVVSRDGAVWFTDPRYGLDLPDEGYGGAAEVEGCHVYRVDPFGMRFGVRTMTAAHPPMPAPNGLAFAPGETALYVTDSETCQVLGFVLRISLEGQELGHRWVVHEAVEGRPDGLRVDPAGRLWVSTGAGVEILAPPVRGRRAQHLATLRTPDAAANLAFTPDHTRLAITATGSTYVVALGDVTA